MQTHALNYIETNSYILNKLFRLLFLLFALGANKCQPILAGMSLESVVR